VHITLARAYSSAGVPERAVDLLETCLAELRSTDPYDVAVEVRYANALSYALSDSGDLARAGEVLNEALDRARESGDDPYMRVRLYWSLARLAEMEGKAGMALHHLRRAIALLEATDDTLHLARAYLSAAIVMIAQGNAEGSLAQLDQAEQLFGPQIARDDAAMVARERSRALVILGRGEEALAKAREAVALFDGRNEPELGSAQAALADALTLQHEYEEADTTFALAVTALTEQTRWREAAQTCQAWARMLRKTGRETEALDVLERAAELGMRLAPAQSLER
jgi:tetratricopeptide (TPR) repeat protein